MPAPGAWLCSRVPHNCCTPKMLNYPMVGCFSEQIQRYVDIFPARNIRIVRHEDWTRNPRRTYLELLQFLQLDDDGREWFPVVNAAVHPKSMRFNALLHLPDVLRLKSRRGGEGRHCGCSKNTGAAS